MHTFHFKACSRIEILPRLTRSTTTVLAHSRQRPTVLERGKASQGYPRHKNAGRAMEISGVRLNIVYREFGAGVVPMVEGQTSTSATSRDPRSCMSQFALPPSGRPTNSKSRCNSRMRPASVCGKTVVRCARRAGVSGPRGGRASRVPCRSATKKTHRASAARLDVTQALARAMKALPARVRQQRPALPRITACGTA